MKPPFLRIFLLCIMVLTFERCAQMAPLTGGDKDTSPPKLVESSPPENTVNFSKRELIFTFDEFVQVRDLSNQFMVSPKLEGQPTIKAEGKKVLVSFDDIELLPNTTYRLSFGKAICDMNESNPSDDFEFVFATGNHIDSLKVAGSVSDAVNNLPVGNILVGLYHLKQPNDSTPYIYVPNYVAKTREDGQYLFKNLPSLAFDIYAFSDKNKNNLYDGETEKVAFLGPQLKLISDTSINLLLFQEEPAKTFIKHSGSPFYGLAQIFFNKKTTIELKALNLDKTSDLFETNPGKEKDTITLFYRNAPDTLKLALRYLNTNRSDTIAISVPVQTKSRNRPLAYRLNTTGGTLPLGDKLKIIFQNWMDTGKVDLKRMSLLQLDDSLKTPISLRGAWKSINTYQFDVPLKPGSTYSFRTDTAAFFDSRGNTNDTLITKFKTRSKLEFGRITLKILLGKKQNYLIQLIDEQSTVVREKAISFSLSSSNAATIDFTDVPPSTYRVKIIFDDNKNQKWDSGNLLLRKQPEHVIINSKQLKIIADWDIEEEIIEKDQK